MLVEQTTCDQLALHLTKLFPDLPSFGRVLPPLLKLVLGGLPMTKVRRRDPRQTLFTLRTTSLPRPVRSEPSLDTDSNVVFYQHE